MVAGVAGGLGEHLGINAWWLRWAFIILAFFGGLGLLIYIAAWLVIPAEGEDDPLIGSWARRLDTSDGGTIFGVVLIGVAAIILFTQIAGVSSTFIIAAILFVVGMLLYRGDLRMGEPRHGDPDATPPAATPAKAPGTAAVVADGVDTPKEQKPPKPAKPPKPPKPPRETSMLGRLTLAIGLIVVASMAIIDMAFDRVDIQPVHYFAAAVAIIGVGLLVGGWAGRARWLIFIGLLLIPAMWVASLVPANWSISAGEVEHRPTSAAEVEVSYDHGFGQMTIDLSELSRDELAQVGSITGSMGLGELIVRVPADVGVLLKGEVGAGEISGPFETVDGVGIDIVTEFGPSPVDLVLDLEVGVGVIVIKGPSSFLSFDSLVLEGSN
jgi:phage shock protein PspC (stress-responsive transcriptional regulator)